MSRRRHDADADSGAVAVEAAILVPLLMLLLFGVIEFSLFMRDALAVNEMAQVGARSASAMPRQTDFTSVAADAMARAGVAMPKSNVREILIYRANTFGLPGNQAAGENPSCAGTEVTCDQYVWDGGTSSFVLGNKAAGQAWNPMLESDGTVFACSEKDVSPDSVGVAVRAEHPWVTGLFGSSRMVQGRAVLPFEILPRKVCGT